MAARKKRIAKKKQPPARKTRSSANNKSKETSSSSEEKTSSVVDESEESTATETASKCPMTTRKAKAASSHKKFGKFRYLLEDTDKQETDSEVIPGTEAKSPEESEPVRTNIEEPEKTEVTTTPRRSRELQRSCSIDSIASSSKPPSEEMALATTNDVIIEEVTMVNSSDNSNVGASAQMDYTNLQESHPLSAETLAAELLEHFSDLKVKPAETESADVEEAKVYVEEPSDDSGNSIFCVENLDTEFTVECVTEEVIPVGDVQDIETDNSSEVVLEAPKIEEEEKQANQADEDSKSIGLQNTETNSPSPRQKGLRIRRAPNKLSPVITSGKRTSPVASAAQKAAKFKSKAKAVKKKVLEKISSDTSESSSTSENSVRRSTRIKYISVLKQKTKTPSKTKIDSKAPKKGSSNESDASENSNSCQADSEKLFPNFVAPASGYESDQKPVKVKSRWRRSSELEMGNSSPNAIEGGQNLVPFEDKGKSFGTEIIKSRLKQFVHLKENSYLTGKVICKEAKKMFCDCFLSPEEVGRGEYGCGEDCLNRLLMIECGPLCPLTDKCTNKRFQKSQFAPCDVFHTDKKGLGICATAIIPFGEFILEYVGEVIDPDEFEVRATEYSKDKNPHYYFMSLRADAVIDATQKGNISRFINHSCDPNAETQKWTVNGELRIGFFSKRSILPGEEITFDYQFQRYGKEAQKCFCEAPNCRGWLGEEPDEDDDDDDEEDDDEEENGEPVEEQESKEIVEQQPPEIQSVIEIIAPEEPTATVEVKIIPGEPPIIVPEVPVAPKPVVKKERKKSNKIKPRKDIFDGVDVEEEIEMLMTTGLKNQAHTLKLSRLMVRATEPSQKTRLLRVLRRGELPCRRLFLDYHGLRLIHGWMTDAQQMCKIDPKQESLRLELLQTLATLPIPNKTMLQDSKVLPTVEKWSALCKDDEIGGVDSESNSPQLDLDQTVVVETKVTEEIKIMEEPLKIVETEAKPKTKEELVPKPSEDHYDIRKSVGMDIENIRPSSQSIFAQSDKTLADEIADMFDDGDDMDISPIAFNDDDPSAEIKEEIKKLSAAEEELKYYLTEIIALAVKLLEEWAVLKEVFRIPKKERIEQMKEHEREANKGNKTGMGLEPELERKSTSRYRVWQRHRNRAKAAEVNPRNKSMKVDNRIMHGPRINKHERRKLFAIQVEQEEVERRRKQWRQHEQHCAVMGGDPRLSTPLYEPSPVDQFVWNTPTVQWQNYPVPQNMPPQRFNTNVHYPYNTVASMTNLPNILSIANIPPPMANTLPLHMPSMSSGLQQPLANIPLPMTNLTTSLPPLSLATISTSLPPPFPAVPPMPSNPALPSLPPLSYQDLFSEKEDPSQVKFAGPIPPPVKLPLKWKCAKDKYGRPYYYHIKTRISQWEPPEFPVPVEIEEEDSDSTSSSETSSLSSESSSEDSEDDDDMDDTRLMLEIRKKFNVIDTTAKTNLEADISKIKPVASESIEDTSKIFEPAEQSTSSLEERLKEEFKFFKTDESTLTPSKRKRSGLVTEIFIISPRTEEDKLMARENVKKYKETKEKLKKQKETLVEPIKKRVKVTVKSSKPTKKHKSASKTKLKEMIIDLNSDTAKKIKELFRANMAGVMVGILNAYRKLDCKEGRITNTEDFKHLARKLTHFVMLKELKHCKKIEELTCTESVKAKAKEFVRKYMSKFGEVYHKPKDDIEY